MCVYASDDLEKVEMIKDLDKSLGEMLTDNTMIVKLEKICTSSRPADPKVKQLP